MNIAQIVRSAIFATQPPNIRAGKFYGLSWHVKVSLGHAVLRDPERQLWFRHISSSNTKHRFDGIHLGSGQTITIERQEKTDAEKSRSFIAVHKGMVLRYSITVGSCQFRKSRGNVISMGIEGARKS